MNAITGLAIVPTLLLASLLPTAVTSAAVSPGYIWVEAESATDKREQTNDWYDPVYNIATGMAFSFDLHDVIDLTPASPLIVSTTPSERFHTWRYSHWMHVDDEIWVYAEVARPNDSNEIRLFRLQR